LFVPHLEPVWRECQRTLRPGGLLITAFLNPDEFVFDPDSLDQDGIFVVKYPLPYVEHETMIESEVAERVRSKGMFHFSHTMESQLGGILHSGFVITDFYEDRRPEWDQNPISDFMPSLYVVRAERI
jgi:SAM-dependent methyltransferase